MAAGASQTYATTFTIAGKLLSSFSGAMTQAQSRLKGLEKTTKAVNASIKSMTGLLIGAAAAMGARAIFSKIFEGAEEAAEAAENRTRKMVTSLMQLRDINAKGREYSEAQVKILEQGNEELAKHSVYSKEILNAGIAQLTVAAVPPKYIKQAIGPMQDLLAVSRGTTATVEDMGTMAKSFGVAIKTGMTKQLKQFGIYLTPLEKQYLQTLAKAGDYQASYNFLLEKMKFAAGEAARLLLTPVGRIHKAQENIKEMGMRVRKALLPDQAAMEEAWSNAMLALEPALTDFERTITHVKTWAAQEFGDLVKRLQEPDGVKAAKDLADAVKGIGLAFGFSNKEGKSLGTMLGDWLAGELHQTAEDFIHLERIIVNVRNWWTKLVGSLTAGLDLIWTKLKKVVEEFENWQPPWWMPGAAIIKGGKAIYHAGAGVRSSLAKSFSPASPEDWAKFTSSGPTAAAAAAAGAGPGAAAGAGAGPTPAAAPPVPMSAATLAGIKAEREPLIKELQAPGTRELFAAAMRAEGASASDQANVAEALVNRAASHRLAGTYKGMRHELTGGFYGPVNRGEIGAPSAGQLAIADKVLADLGAGRNVLEGRTDQGMINEIKGAKRRFGEDYYGMMSGLPQQYKTAAYRAKFAPPEVPEAAGSKPPPLLAAVPGMQFGGIATRPMLAQIAERGAEAVIPLGRGGRGMGGIGGTAVHFMPNITIHGGGSGAEIQEGMVEKLRDLSREFVAQFHRAQQHERRLSYEGGYG